MVDAFQIPDEAKAAAIVGAIDVVFGECDR
jgi:hypothetical protein